MSREQIESACEIGMALAFIAFVGVMIGQAVKSGRKFRETIDFVQWERETDGL